jgi:hypothetical protein
MAGMVGIESCSKALTQTDLFGEGSYCVWPSADELNIWLGSNARVEVANLVTFKSGVIAYVPPLMLRPAAKHVTDTHLCRSAAGAIPLRELTYPIALAPKPIMPLPFIQVRRPAALLHHL